LPTNPGSWLSPRNVPRVIAGALAVVCASVLAPDPRSNWLARGASGWGLSSALAADVILMPPRDAFRSARGEGMGGAVTAVADDGDALFHNPAGIGREDGDASKNALRGASFPNATFGANKYTLGMFRDYQGSSDRSSAIEKTMLSAGDKDVVYGHAQAFPYLTVWRFQLGFLTSVWGEGYLTRYDEPQPSREAGAPEGSTYDREISAIGLAQQAVVAGFSLPYKETGLSLGVAGRFAYRNSFRRDIEATESSVRTSARTYRDDLNATRGAAADVGVLYRVRGSLLPAFGIAMRDVGDTHYAPAKAGARAEKERANLAAGFSLRPEVGKNAGLTLGVDVQRINDGRLPIRDKVKMGAELGIGASDSTAPFALRGGYDLRAPSVGIGADLLFLKVDAAWFGDVVEGPDGTRVDMRTLIKATVDLRL
jgi:hypothetical protein